MDNLKDDLNDVVSRVRNFTLSVLEGEPNRLYDASRTYLASGGKKLRPFMVIKSCEMFAGREEKALPAAAAVELIHNFSLIHDMNVPANFVELDFSDFKTSCKTPRTISRIYKNSRNSINSKLD